MLVAFTAVSIAVALLWPAIPQPAGYHDFADQRAIFGIHNFFDVASNAALFASGIAGLGVVVLRRTRFAQRAEVLPYALFFVGVALSAVGSAYYHLAPDNERLFWDRLPMTVAFMSLIAAQVADRIGARLGLALLVPMLIVGAASVVYWIDSERAGAGNVVPYAVLQGYSMVALLLMAVTLPSRYTHGKHIYLVFAGYAAAKVLETFDREVMAIGGLVSGHSLKHGVAAVAALLICRMLWLRKPAMADAPA